MRQASPARIPFANIPESRAVLRVSIGLPVFNGAEFLRAAIQSILDQTFTDFELIICDNGSQDGTQEICQAFVKSDPRVRYIRQPSNLGAAKNYNRAFAEAQGEYFKWAAHDDLLSVDFLQRSVDALDADPGCLLVYGGTTLIDEFGVVQSCYIDRLASQSDDPVVRFANWMARPRGQCNPVFGLVRREQMAKTILHGDYIGADRILLGEFALRGRITMLRKPMFYRRIHAGMSTRANPDSLSRSAWFTGGKAHGLRFKRWRQLREYFAMVHKVNLSLNDRFRSYGVILRWMMALRSEYIKELLLHLYINGEATRLKRWMRARKAARKAAKGAA